METLPRKIKREIKRANRKANRLRRKLGLKNVKSKCTKKTITEIEIKVPYEDYINGKIPSIKDTKEYAYFYNRGDGYFGAEKIKDEKLKEYYEIINPSISEDFFNRRQIYKIKNFYISSLKELVEILSNNIKNELVFGLNGKIFYLNYCSFNLKNQITDLYFYEYGISSNHEFLKDVLKEGREILRFSLEKNRLDRVYLEEKTKENLTVFYYYDITTQNTLVLKECLLQRLIRNKVWIKDINQ